MAKHFLLFFLSTTSVDFIFVDFDKILDKFIYLFGTFLGNYFLSTLPSRSWYKAEWTKAAFSFLKWEYLAQIILYRYSLQYEACGYIRSWVVVEEKDGKSLNLAFHSYTLHTIEGLASVFNIEVFTACQMPLWPSKNFFVFGALHKNVFCKVFTIHSEGLFKNCLLQNMMAAICK